MQTEDDSKKYAGWLPYEIEVTGADHEGIIHEISHHLASQGINIENMDTSSAPAPMSGTPLFTMQGIIVVPPQLNFNMWSNALEEIGDKLKCECQGWGGEVGKKIRIDKSPASCGAFACCRPIFFFFTRSGISKRLR
ncbi:hypothetical protein [Candidatus Villigracilis proximus]|uniref:glycine cleavage system protein R n=1 Tax=Candidatus Villigracilis proximus TaxID=3140683 RepID=UPI0031E8B768